MENIDYTINDQIVSIKDMTNGEGTSISENQIFTALELTSCNCNRIFVNIGIKSQNGCKCAKCHKMISTTNILALATNFKKLDNLVSTQMQEIEEILKTPIFENL